jgi:lysophospholipid acyltransferase (LPLAT)-like uncharacterized protein
MGFFRKSKNIILSRLGKWAISLTVRTCSVSVRGQPDAEAASPGTPQIYLFWHCHIFYVIHQFKNRGARPLVSLSEDGELVSGIARRFGMDPVRGSSSKGGARAFLEMISCLREGKGEILITADGPRGPAREIKEGTILLARKTGAQVVPVSWYGSRVKIFRKSWDRFMIPLPFSRICTAFGRPVKIGDQGIEYWRRELGQKLNDLENDLMAECNRSRIAHSGKERR